MPAPHPTRTAPKCVQCEHRVYLDSSRPLCKHPSAPVDLVTGAGTPCDLLRSCDVMQGGATCGPAGTWFEPRGNAEGAA